VTELRQREIQADPALEKNFLRCVERLDPERGAAVYARAVTGEVLSSADLAFLAYARRDFSNRLDLGEELKSKITLSDIATAKRRNAALRNEVDLGTDEQALQLMQEQAVVLAMKMTSDELAQVTRAYDTLERARNTSKYVRWEKGVRDVLERSNVSWEEYKDVFRFGTKGDRVETRREIQRRIDEGQTTLSSVFSWFNPFSGGSNFRKADRIARKALSLEQKLQKPGTIQEADRQLDVITTFMKMTLSHDPEVRRAWQQTAMRDENVAAVETAPPTFKELRGINTRLRGNAELTPARIKEAYERDITARNERIGGRAFAEWTPQEKQSRLRSWDIPETMTQGAMRQSSEPREARGGLFSRILGLLFDLVVGRQKDQVRYA